MITGRWRLRPAFDSPLCRPAFFGWLVAIILLNGTTIYAASARAAALGLTRSLASPDGEIQVSIQLPQPGTSERPTWSASFRNQPVLSRCTLGLATLDAGELLAVTWWNETRVLVGQIGEILVTARRKGTSWYLGGISAKKPRDLQLPLSFLAPGKYLATVWQDAADAETQPNHLTVRQVSLSPTATLSLHVATDGGFVAEIQRR